MKGVYVIHDQTSGKLYVGSACGDAGLWTRWGQYVESLHGGNIDLRALVEREGDEYVRDNLVFALLEFWSMRTPDDHLRQPAWFRRGRDSLSRSRESPRRANSELMCVSHSLSALATVRRLPPDQMRMTLHRSGGIVAGRVAATASSASLSP
jgi:hypothetical protein